MNGFAEANVEGRVKLRTEARRDDEGEGNRELTSLSHDSKTAGVRDVCDSIGRISPPMTTNWKDVAVPRYFADYIVRCSVDDITDLSFIPQLCHNLDSRHSFREALDAVALRSLANQVGSSWLSIEATKSYGRALRSFTSVLQNIEEAQRDTTLATIYLFTFYEVSAHSACHGPGNIIKQANR